MKKILISFLIIVTILIVGVIFLSTVDFNRIGKQTYYTEITTTTNKITKEKDSSGNIYKTYHYKLASYDKNGTQKVIAFTAQKSLRQQAFLKLYVKKNGQVSSYDEVKEKDLPEKVAAQLTR